MEGEYDYIQLKRWSKYNLRNLSAVGNGHFATSLSGVTTFCLNICDDISTLGDLTKHGVLTI